MQNTIRQLIDWESGKVAFQNTCNAFGNGVTEAIPYAYVGKRYDASTGLIYFGKRFYDPSLGRWLTPDPIGAVDHSNLYQYVFNNPHLYRDINGEFAILLPLLFWGVELALPAISVYVTAIAYGTATGVIAYGGYKLVEAMNERDYPGVEDYYSGGLISGLKHLNWNMKNGSVDPSLPANPDDLTTYWNDQIGKKLLILMQGKKGIESLKMKKLEKNSDMTQANLDIFDIRLMIIIIDRIPIKPIGWMNIWMVKVNQFLTDMINRISILRIMFGGNNFYE